MHDSRDPGQNPTTPAVEPAKDTLATKDILVVSHLALPHVGGVEILVDREIRQLTSLGCRVVHVTSKLGTTPHSVGNEDTRVRVVRVPAWHILERRAHLAYPLFSPTLLPILWREVGRCEVVHIHGFIFLSSVVAAIMARLRDKPCLLTDHGGIQTYHSRVATLLARVAVETLGRLTARLASCLVTFNARVTRDLERLAGTRKKSLFLPNPVDGALFRPPTSEERATARRHLGWDPSRPKVLFVGRFIPDKGIRLIQEAADPAYDLVFCGSGDMSLLGPLPRPGIEYLPPRPQSELVTLYHAADVLVLPSLREGFPLVVQEALSCGMSVILSEDEGYAPYRRISRLTLCPRRPETFREAILQSLARPSPVEDEDSRLAMEELCPRTEDWIRRLYGWGTGLNLLKPGR